MPVGSTGLGVVYGQVDALHGRKSAVFCVLYTDSDGPRNRPVHRGAEWPGRL